MQNIQQLIVLFAFILLVIMGVFPPWVFIDEHKVQHPMGYAPLWKPPVERHQDSAEFLGFKLRLDVQTQAANNIDINRLLLQVVLLSTATGGAVILLNFAKRRAAV